MILTATIYDDNDEPITVTGELEPACRGARDCYGAQMEPDTDTEIDILEAVDARGNPVILTQDQEVRAMDEFYDSCGDYSRH